MKKLAVLSLILMLAAPNVALAQGQSRHGRGGDERSSFAPRDRDDEGGRGKGRGKADRPRERPQGERPQAERPRGERPQGNPGGNGRGPRGDGPPGRANRGGQQDDARTGVRQGRRVPLRDVVPQIQRRSPGRMLDSFPEEGPGGRPQYRVRWQSDSGERIDYIVDAETGAILRRE